MEEGARIATWMIAIDKATGQGTDLVTDKATGQEIDQEIGWKGGNVKGKATEQETVIEAEIAMKGTEQAESITHPAATIDMAAMVDAVAVALKVTVCAAEVQCGRAAETQTTWVVREAAELISSHLTTMPITRVIKATKTHHHATTVEEENDHELNKWHWPKKSSKQ